MADARDSRFLFDTTSSTIIERTRFSFRSYSLWNFSVDCVTSQSIENLRALICSIEPSRMSNMMFTTLFALLNHSPALRVFTPNAFSTSTKAVPTLMINFDHAVLRDFGKYFSTNSTLSRTLSALDFIFSSSAGDKNPRSTMLVELIFFFPGARNKSRIAFIAIARLLPSSSPPRSAFSDFSLLFEFSLAASSPSSIGIFIALSLPSFSSVGGMTLSFNGFGADKGEGASAAGFLSDPFFCSESGSKSSSLSTSGSSSPSSSFAKSNPLDRPRRTRVTALSMDILMRPIGSKMKS
mmetsp:Transcript_16033/g.25403  ORF Transcript_16033/g.25403 Transcript_16033/m.25403 type:complete len:295 (+) Transcript_16033:1016-1900(+)